MQIIQFPSTNTAKPEVPNQSTERKDPIETISNEAVQEWLRYHKRNSSDRTLYEYTKVIQWFLAFIGPDRSIDSVVLEDIERWMDSLLAKGNSPNTVNDRMTALKSFWTWHSERHSVANIAREIPKLKENEPKQRCLTEEEYAAVLAACDSYERDIIAFFGNTGLRRREFLAVEASHVFPDRKTLKVPKGKGNKFRIIPLNSICQDILARNIAPDGHFILHDRRRSAASINRLCVHLSHKTGIPLFGPHALRHRFATMLFKQNVPAKVISKILGHSSLAVTEMVYCHLLPMDLIGATDCLNQ